MSLLGMLVKILFVKVNMNDGWNKQIWLVIDAIKTMFTKDLIYGIQNPKSDIEKKGKSDLTQRP